MGEGKTGEEGQTKLKEMISGDRNKGSWCNGSTVKYEPVKNPNRTGHKVPNKRCQLKFTQFPRKGEIATWKQE